MNVYKVFTTEKVDCMFPTSVIKSVIVIAKCEKDALNTVIERYSDMFAGKNENLKIELFEKSESPMIINVEYFNDYY